MKNGIAAAALAGGLAACATIVEGTTQRITVDVHPPTGTCRMKRNGQVIGESVPGQRVVQVEKSQADITFVCSAPGHQNRVDVLSSSLSPATVASFFLLDFGIVDAATGAWKKYPDRLTIVLQPEHVAPLAKRGR